MDVVGFALLLPRETMLSVSIRTVWGGMKYTSQSPYYQYTYRVVSIL